MKRLSVHIVTDSTSDLPAALAAEHDIAVVPLTVFFGDDPYRDGIDIDPDRFFHLLTQGKDHPRTSAPAVGEFQSVYERLAADDDVLSIHISSKLSGTLNAAFAARGAAAASHEIQILDSETASLALGLAAIAAAREAKGGGNLLACREAAESVMKRTSLYFILDTLEYLRRGGRIGRAQALVGGILNIKPILTVRDGVVAPFEKVRARSKAVARLRELIAAAQRPTDIAVLHSTSTVEAADLERFARETHPDASVFTGRVGPVIGTYVGPACLGIGIVEAP